MFDNCLDCPFCYTKKLDGLTVFKCDSNGRKVGVAESYGFKEHGYEVQITPPFWCPYNDEKK